MSYKIDWGDEETGPDVITFISEDESQEKYILAYYPIYDNDDGTKSGLDPMRWYMKKDLEKHLHFLAGMQHKIRVQQVSVADFAVLLADCKPHAILRLN